MTANEKLEKIKKLADAMYNAAAYLGPVGSGERLYKTMDDYHQFIIHEYHKEETISENLETEIIQYIGYPQEVDEDVSTTMIRKAARHFANWQRQQLIKDAVDAVVDSMTVQKNTDSLFFKVIWPAGQKPCKVGDKVKLIIIKEK